VEWCNSTGVKIFGSEEIIVSTLAKSRQERARETVQCHGTAHSGDMGTNLCPVHYHGFVPWLHFGSLLLSSGQELCVQMGSVKAYKGA
jgi:hypothetical protein